MHVESLEGRWLLADFGDAPAPYPTTLAANGARHEEVGPMLGALRDSEPNGVPSVGATSDGPDDDGVTFGTIRVGQLAATVTVNVQSPNNGGRLDAWIDFNADGNWGGAGEQIADRLFLPNGDNTLAFDVPAWAVDGLTYARFRISSGGNLGIRGAANNGEVEDYAVTILPPVAHAPLFDAQRTITTGALGARGVHAADIDGDGDMDVISASADDNDIVWYENNGNQGFTPRLIDGGISDAASVFAADMDGDGDLDVLSSSDFSDSIQWHENDGTPNDGTWPRHGIYNDANGQVIAADMDGDGDMDVLAASMDDFEFYWFENNGAQVFTRRDIGSGIGARTLAAADVDRDGDIDVVGVVGDEFGFDADLLLFRNNGSQSFSEEEIDDFVGDVRDIALADIDGDGDQDVLTAAFEDGRIEWFENRGGSWSGRTIDGIAREPTSVYAADMDGDGDIDVLSASSRDDAIYWYENDGTPSVGAWPRTTITDEAIGASGVFAADVDGDGDLDVLSASEFDDRIAWYSNQLPSDYGDAPTPYPTTRAQNGPRHETRGPRLGATRDGEADGIPSGAASSDGADEDGVVFGALQIGNVAAVAMVDVQNAPAGARLDAWIDFNRDNFWGGPGEQIAASLPVVEGANVVTFEVPGWASDGTSYARFRISTAGGLGVRGAADDGEVEDYAVTILPPAAHPAYFVGALPVGSALLVTDVFTADVDGDGDLDVLSASGNDNRIAWYENDGNQNYTTHTITAAAAGARSVFAADVDGDGDMDAVSAWNNAPGTIAWHENDGNQTFTTRIINAASPGAWGVIAADVDVDGDVDIIASSSNNDTIAWYENNGNQAFTQRIISTAADFAAGIHAIDVDRDGDLDVVAASFLDNTIAWHQNNGSQGFTERIVTTAAIGAIDAFAGDLDGDGDIDLLSASLTDNSFHWYENNGGQVFTRRLLGTASGASSVTAADVDGDGDLDVLATARGTAGVSPNLIVFQNNGDRTFTMRTISDAETGADVIAAADADADGDLDLFYGLRGAGFIRWYENTTCAGDFDGDHDIDLSDAAVMQSHLGLTSGATAAQGDIDGDGAVDRHDAALLAVSFGRQCGVPVGGSPAAASAVIARYVVVTAARADEQPAAEERTGSHLHIAARSRRLDASRASLRDAQTIHRGRSTETPPTSLAVRPSRRVRAVDNALLSANEGL